MSKSFNFYQHDRFRLELQGKHSRSLLNGPNHSLTERVDTAAGVETRLLTTDKHGSVLQVQADQAATSYAYTAYGHYFMQGSEPPRVGFNGEWRDRFTGFYLLGQGYRAFNPVLMRFQSPDSFSPFDEGGISTYAYCSGDPVNATDPTGHVTVAQIAAVRLKPTRNASVNFPAQKSLSPTRERRKVRFALEKTTYRPHRTSSDAPRGALTHLNPSNRPAMKRIHHNPRSGRILFNDRRIHYSNLAQLNDEHIQLNKIAHRRALAHEYLTNEAIQLSEGIERIRLKAYDDLDNQFKEARQHLINKLNTLRQPG